MPRYSLAYHIIFTTLIIMLIILIGLTIQDYGSVIREVCAIYSVPVIDVNALSGISTLNITTYLQDQVHPNSAGGMKIANVVIDALIQYVLMDLTNPYIEDTKM